MTLKNVGSINNLYYEYNIFEVSQKSFLFLSLYQLVYFLLLKNNGIFYAYPKCEGRSGIWHKNLNDRKNKLFINFKIS